MIRDVKVKHLSFTIKRIHSNMKSNKGNKDGIYVYSSQALILETT